MTKVALSTCWFCADQNYYDSEGLCNIHLMNNLILSFEGGDTFSFYGVTYLLEFERRIFHDF